MIEEKDIQDLENRFDLRYKLIKDCNDEMDEAPDEQTRREIERLAAKMER